MTSSISAPPAFIFQMALLTLLCLYQLDWVITPIEKPKRVSDVIADITSRGHAPRLHRLLSTIAEDAVEGARPLPWITLSLIPEGVTLTWTSLGSTMFIRYNRNLAFCL